MKRTIFLAVCVFVAGQLFAQSDKDHRFKVVKNLEVFNTIYKHLDLLYVDTLDADEVVGTAINAMLSSLDPYTEYYPEESTSDLKEMFTGKFAGIGSLVRFNHKLKNVVIEEPYENMPAAEAGLRRGDIILSINDSSMAGKDVAYVSNRLRGDAGTTIKVKVKRPATGKTIQFKVTRRTVQNPSVPFYGMQGSETGYIQLNSFNENCSKDVRRAFIELKNQGMKSLVLDLRGNGGGSEMEAVRLVNMFVPKGKLVVSNRGKQKRANHDYLTTVEPLDSVMPLVVLVNGGSASSSEIVSGALQDLDRAVILGTRTYGKGLVQMPVDLPYNGLLKLTTNKYYIPSGRCIQAVNYNRGRGGKSEQIPDSLTNIFYTANGREVRDGGGITPDVVIRPDSLANITYYLSVLDTTEVMHDYILDYVNTHPKIAPAATFDLTDAEYEQFKQRVLASNFTYDRESEKYLKDLIKLAQFEGYYEDAKEEFENLKRKLNHNVEKDLDFNKEQIKQMLTADIVSDYYFQRGTIENSLRHDKQLKEAIRLLQTPDEYGKLLMPEKK